MKVHPSNADHIGVEFKVWAPLLNRVTKKLFLLGSLKELGAWDIDKALQAFPTSDMHTWNVEVSVPAMSQFEWTWLTTNLNRSGLEWEKPNRRTRTVDCCSGTLHTIYGDIDEVFLQSATCLEVTTYMRVEEGLTLVLTGSTPSTGEWDLRYSKKATEFPQRSGFWKAHVAFDALTNLEFKWTIVKEKDQGVSYLQEKLPHSVFGRRTWLRAVAPWNTPHVIVIDTSLLCDLPDTVQGRTEVIVKEHKRRGQEVKNWLAKADSEKEIKTPTTPATPSTPAAAAAKSPWYTTSSMEKLMAIVPLSSMVQLQRMPPAITPPPPQTPSVMSATHVPSVQRTLDLDEHIRQRQDSLSKTERLTQQLSKVLKEENTVYSIKGTGQTQVSSDKLNSDLSVGTSEGIIRAYGEVAEITSIHLLSYTNKQRSSVTEIHEQLEKNGKQSRERSLTKVQIHEVIPDGESLQMKAVCDEVHEDEAVVGGTLEIMPLCVTSQTIADTVPSDTGFTELSSWMSSTKTDQTASESALISSHTMTCLLGADASNVSDGEESQSDQAIISSRRSSNPVEGMPSYWETQQNDLSPPWLDKAKARVQAGSGDFLSDCLDAMEDDFEHLEWLSSKLEEQSAYEMLQYGTGLGKTFQISADDAFLFTQEKIPPVQALKNDHSIWSPSSPPKASPKTQSPLGVTSSNDDNRDMLDGSKEKSASTAGHYLPSGWDFVDFEDDEISERRSIARIIEAQWGASYYKASEGETGKDILAMDLPYRKNGTECNDTSYPVFAEGLRYLMYSDGKKNKATYYSFDELSDMILPDADVVDHRARAREAEKQWGRRPGGEISSVQ